MKKNDQVINILHLTHTDINSDSRILKEMNGIANTNPIYKVHGIGILDHNSRTIKNSEKLTIHSLELKSRGYKKLPAIIRYLFVFIELMIKTCSLAFHIKPKLVHCHDFVLLPIAVFIKVFSGSKLIYDAHELESRKSGVSENFGKLIFFIEKVLWFFIDALIVVSYSIETWYNQNVGDKKTEIIMNSPVIENDIKEVDSSYLREKFSIASDSKIFLYIGLLTKGRGIDLMIEAFTKNQLQSSLVFLGYGDLEEELKTVSQQYENIYLHEAIPHHQVVSVARSADYGLCLIQNISLSDYYCLPNKLFEYSFAGVSVLASDFPDISYTVNKYQLGRCTKLESVSINQAVKELETTEQSKQINPKDLYDLSWEAQEVKLIKLYSSLLKI